MKRTVLSLLSFFGVAYGLAQPTDTIPSKPDTINQRIFLIGDAGEIHSGSHPVVDWLKKHVNWNDEKNTVIYLGDNIYPLGLPLEGDPSYDISKRIIDYQISLVKGKKSRAYFIPGNHDWRNGKIGGWQQVVNQQDYINSQELKNVQAWPLYGCPGPVEVEVTDKVVLALVDSQWFLHMHDKPGPGSTCSSKSIEEFQTELGEIAAAHPNQLMIVAMHHPPHTYGVHGGVYTWKEHIFPFTALKPNLYIPLPVLGSVYPLTRGVFGNIQDVGHPLYRTMANSIEEVIKLHPYPIVVSGHDHSLQMIMKDSIPFIVSGAGVKSTRAREGDDKLFSDLNLGFVVIEVWNSGKSEVKFYNILSPNYNTPTFRTSLKTILPVTPPATVDTTRPIFDSVVIVAANPALEGNGIKRFLVGQNYRKEWTQPVRIPVLDLATELGGLKPVKQGGGKQTRSLRVEDASGKEWALRSVEKDPEAAIPPDLRQTFVKDVVNDGISASYPYGALSMGVLSKAAGVPYLRNRLVYLPDDPRLDRFRADFKNMVALMEERQPPGVKKTDNTDEVVLKMAKDNDDHIDQRAVLKARLLDNFVMDLDRHEGQWEWATRDTGKGKIYYPIPKDRDQVFYVNQGLIPRFAKKPWFVPELQGFKAKADNIKTFNRAARNFDRAFLNELPEEVWTRQVDSFLRSMTDEVIETALRQQPPEIQPYSADKIISTLKDRRNYFAAEMKEYYRFLSRIVTVVGSNQREQFTITKRDGGLVQVVVHKIAKDSSISSKIYDRIFDPAVTKELRIFGLNDEDRFIVEGGHSPIKIRLIGGSGNDAFINNGSGKKVLAYDASFEKNSFSGSTSFRDKVSDDPQVNRYDRLNFKYNFINPGLKFEYNIDDGVFVGLELEYTKQGFRKEPYAMHHYVSGARAFNTRSLHFVYNAEFIKALGNTDLVIRSDFRAPVNVTNFFGIGNNTVFDQTKPGGIQYYRTRYNFINASVYLRRQLQSWMRINIGPSVQFFNLDSAENVGKFVATAFPGVDNEVLYGKKAFLGADARLDINSKNNQMLPTRGFVLDMGLRPLFGLNSQSSNILQASVDMRIFMSLATRTRLVLATRFGWGKNYGDFEFPQAMYLGGTENLRGFRRQRFAGRSMLYNNTELRIKLADFNTYLFPGSLGILVFNDIGRVWADNEDSGRWHDGYGVGIWVAPVRRFVLAAMVGRSEEEKAMPRVTFGFQF
ncbi:MAG TPA: BamA/TamA family outer membrane protein [Flavisolibacter sp.]|nr:BamA/TamA family outer membrane protein [Flavisolibacter sp.]